MKIEELIKRNLSKIIFIWGLLGIVAAFISVKNGFGYEPNWIEINNPPYTSLNMWLNFIYLLLIIWSPIWIWIILYNLMLNPKCSYEKKSVLLCILLCVFIFVFALFYENHSLAQGSKFLWLAFGLFLNFSLVAFVIAFFSLKSKNRTINIFLLIFKSFSIIYIFSLFLVFLVILALSIYEENTYLRDSIIINDKNNKAVFTDICKSNANSAFTDSKILYVFPLKSKICFGSSYDKQFINSCYKNNLSGCDDMCLEGTAGQYQQDLVIQSSSNIKFVKCFLRVKLEGNNFFSIYQNLAIKQLSDFKS